MAADTSPLQIDGREVPFTQKFKLMEVSEGGMLAYNLKGDAEIEEVLRAHSNRFENNSSVPRECKQFSTRKLLMKIWYSIFYQRVEGCGVCLNLS